EAEDQPVPPKTCRSQSGRLQLQNSSGRLDQSAFGKKRRGRNTVRHLPREKHSNQSRGTEELAPDPGQKRSRGERHLLSDPENGLIRYRNSNPPMYSVQGSQKQALGQRPRATLEQQEKSYQTSPLVPAGRVQAASHVFGQTQVLLVQ